MCMHEVRHLQNLMAKRRELYQDLARFNSNVLSRAVGMLNKRHIELKVKIRELENQCRGSLAIIHQVNTGSTQLDATIARLDFSNIQTAQQQLQQIQTQITHFINVNSALANEYVGHSDAQLQHRKNLINQQLDALKQRTIVERIRAVRVVGMTLDCFIGRFCTEHLSFDHIFVDEAGYVPLVKALTLCRDNIPVTLIGDHKQLGPVCEMNDDDRAGNANSEVAIWRKSSLFIGELFSALNRQSFAESLQRLDEPRISSIERAPLNKTFRFGQNLASVLSSYVYQGFEFFSDENQQNLLIACINAVPDNQHNKKRENQAEVSAISEYLSKYADSYLSGIVILTPYKNQVKLLNDALPEMRRRETDYDCACITRARVGYGHS